MMKHVWTSNSRGFWRLAQERFMTDRVGVVSFVIVFLFLGLVVLSSLGLIARDWDREVGINNAPPDFWGLLDSPQDIVADAVIEPSPSDGDDEPLNLSVIDPLAELLNSFVSDDSAGFVGDNTEVIDPLADTLRSFLTTSQTPTLSTIKQESLPLGGDRWGHDVLQKTIKGSQTSILVGLTAAILATLFGTLLGAVAGYYGRYWDDALNWLYNVFVAIPYLLLILAIAAVLQQRGVFTVVLIFGLTGWTGVFRLIRAEYIKHRSREYVMAARAFGVSS
ncbi:MAG: ABC transporter permease subunit, partial [Burkholderiales bacterium]|nr:ABC transporter permease subunit [Burkholderiales bacterium]